MRFSKLLVGCAAAAMLAVGALAQESQSAQEPPQQAEPPQQPEPETGGLEGLQGTVNALEDQPAAEQPPPPQPQPQPGPGAAPSAPAPPLSRAELAQLQRHIERGRLLAAIARAGLIATQDMLGHVADPEGAGITGWLAEPAGNAMAVTFYADGDAGPRAVYSANVLGGRVVSRETHVAADRPALTPAQARMAAARAAASAQNHRPCAGDQFNYLVVPPTGAEAPVDVYQISPALQRGRFPLGGHFRTTVSPDGSVAETRGFTNACLEVELP
ncbi:MAG TPA: hypothetical protein VGX37_08015, partial [Allosphingosinicella sp.]|nr:hypothetical protein [Allosphingosinicella sp.]